MGAFATSNPTGGSDITGSGTAGQVAVFATAQSIGNPTISFTNTATGLVVGSLTEIGSAIFGIVSTTQGFLPPAMTNAQRNAISSPASGLMVYSTTASSLSVYNGSAWASLITSTTMPANFVRGDILYASSTTLLSRLADVDTGNALISGGVGLDPSWGKIALTTHVSGILPPDNGGTGIANNAASTITISGNFATTFTVTATTGVTLPDSGTLYGTKTGSISSAQMLASMSDETGTGVLMFATGPTITTNINIPQITGTGTSITGMTVVTSVTASGAVARGVYETPTLIAAANNDILYGHYITPTFTLDAFTGTNSFGLGMLCGTAQIRMGNLTGSTSVAAIYLTTAVPSTTNYFAQESGTNCAVNAVNAAGNLFLRVGNTSVISMGGVSAASNGTTFTALAQTAQTASANIQNWKFTGASKQYATGAQTAQYFTYFSTNTLAFVGASTSTLATSVTVEYITLGTNATVTTSAALHIKTGSLSGGSGTTKGVGVLIEMPTGATNNYGLNIDAGTTTAAPILLTSGTNMTTAVAGAFEYNGTNLFFTRTGTTRQTVLTANVITTEAVASDTTITVNVAGTDYKLLARA